MAENQRQQEEVNECSGGKADKLFIKRQSHSGSPRDGFYSQAPHNSIYKCRKKTTTRNPHKTNILYVN